MIPCYIDFVGYDYKLAVLHLTKHYTREQIGEAMNVTANAVDKVLHGAIPNHVRGEALFAFYCDVFGHKPPLTAAQTAGILNADKDAIAMRRHTKVGDALIHA